MKQLQKNKLAQLSPAELWLTFNHFVPSIQVRCAL